MLYLELKKRLASEKEMKILELKEINLEKLLTLDVHYSEIARKTVGQILQIYLERYLAKLEKVSLAFELGNLPKERAKEEIAILVELFHLNELDLLEEKGGALNRLHLEFFDQFCDPSNGLINWEKLIQFNSGNYKP